MYKVISCLFIFIMLTPLAAEKNNLQPLFLVPGMVVIDMDFENQEKLDRKMFARKQGTRWTMKDGLLQGIESTKAYQEKKKAEGKGHTGVIPRLGIKKTPESFIFKYSFKLEGGKRTKLVPLVEFGHHYGRIYFPDQGMKLLSDHQKKVLWEDDFTIELGTWYHVMIEFKGDEVVVQFQDGPTVYAKDATLRVNPPVIGIAGTRKGAVLIDNMALYQANVVSEEWVENKQKIISTLIKKQ